MGQGLRSITGLMVTVALVSGSCGSQLGEETCLGRRTTVEYAGKRIGVDVPAPTYLPDGYEIKEVYLKERNHGSNDSVILLISDDEIIWQDDDYQCKIRMSIVYGSLVGLKMPWARDVMLGEIGGYGVVGHLVEEEDGCNSLWYQWYPDPHGHYEGWEIIISTAVVISDEELIQMAESTLH